MEDRFADVAIVIGIIAVIVLKIMNVITISWLWLLSPIWIPLCIGLILSFLLALYFFGTIIIDKIKEN